jgi:DNA-binding GntR family transcriptional regulator
VKNGLDPGGRRGPVALAAAVPPQRAAAGVLADRIAAAVVQREPGWRLPRRSALARRYNVSVAEIDLAIGELVRRSLIRRLPDGQVYRASPAEYLIPLEGVGGLSTRLDPMGVEIASHAVHVSQRAAPQDVASALGVDRDAPFRIVRCVWAAGPEPVAVSTAYVPEAVARPAAGDDPDCVDAIVSWIPAGGPGTAPACAKALEIELSPAQPSVARSLRLAPGQPTISVTIRFDDSVTGLPVGLTMASLKPDRFRVVAEIGAPLTARGRQAAR